MNRLFIHTKEFENLVTVQCTSSNTNMLSLPPPPLPPPRPRVAPPGRGVAALTCITNTRLWLCAYQAYLDGSPIY